MPDVLKEVDGVITSACCNTKIEVTRVVRDLVTYDPETYYSYRTLTGQDIQVLNVKYTGKTDCLDSETGYIVKCEGCGQEIDIEVDEE